MLTINNFKNICLSYTMPNSDPERKYLQERSKRSKNESKTKQKQSKNKAKTMQKRSKKEAKTNQNDQQQNSFERCDTLLILELASRRYLSKY